MKSRSSSQGIRPDTPLTRRRASGEAALREPPPYPPLAAAMTTCCWRVRYPTADSTSAHAVRSGSTRRVASDFLIREACFTRRALLTLSIHGRWTQRREKTWELPEDDRGGGRRHENRMTTNLRLGCRKAAGLQAKDPLMGSVLGDGSSGNNITLVEEEWR